MVAEVRIVNSPAVEPDRAGSGRHAEVAVSRPMFKEILSLIARLRAPPAPA
jgi:hypothetical protein